MHLALRINLFPIAPIVWVLKKNLPCTKLLADSNFPKVVSSQPTNPVTCGVATNLAILDDPLSDQLSLLRINFHHTALASKSMRGSTST